MLAETLEFARRDGDEDGVAWEARGERRGSIYAYDEPPAETGLQGAGTVHHVAWASSVEELEAWRDRVVEAGMRPTPVIDRFYFRSVYFREPSGVLFEIATLGPGFTVDEPLESLGEKLSLPPFIEHMRDEIEAKVRPITNPRAGLSAQAPGVVELVGLVVGTGSWQVGQYHTASRGCRRRRGRRGAARLALPTG